jgi:alpha-galactosidase
MIPAMVEIARDVLKYAPQALFFNYSNPMSPVCRGIRKATGAPVVGLCHGVPQVARYLAGQLGEEPEDIEYSGYGINHLTWITGLESRGKDMMPALKKLAEKKAADARKTGTEETDHPFAWELADLTGAFPAVLDRHIVEFFPHMFCRPGGYYGRTLGTESFNFERVIENGDKSYEEMKLLADGSKEMGGDILESIEGEHEQVLDIVDSIREGDRRVYSANLPNEGQISSLPDEAVIECPCSARESGLVPDGGREVDFSPFLAGSLASRFQWVELVVDAALKGDRDLFIQALLIDGSVKDVSMAINLADALIEAQRSFLPEIWG